MSIEKKSVSNDSDEDSVSDDSYLTSVLSMLNGFCKVNLEVQQINSFYSEDSLLPINAKVNSNVRSVQQNPINTNILKNEECTENIWPMNSLNNTSTDEFQIYSKPSYSARVLNKDRKPNLVPKGKKRITFNKTDEELCDVESLHTVQNSFKDCNIGQDDDDDEPITGLQFLQRQGLHSKWMSDNLSNRYSFSNTHLSLFEQDIDNAIQNEDSSKQSECPLCFKLYPSQDIEAHASGCNI